MDAKDMVGTWHLVSCVHRLADGTVSYPFGKEAVGRLVYTADGFMIVTVMEPGRKHNFSPGLFDGTDAERAKAAAGFIAYSGHFEVLENRVVHFVDISLFPNWTGSRQVRSVELDGKRMTLSTRSFVVEGVEQTAHLTWERV
ncbi:MAG: lipocalin-like domain-containing protein [Elusimicrobia bacterium]|nr:lipocalin-like domain-containing protein [Elusimicrobiota bacterium]